jgi:hypothetical protein
MNKKITSSMDLKQKKKLITELIELKIYCGYDVSDLVFKPASYFDFEGVKKVILKYKKEKKFIDG